MKKGILMLAAVGSMLFSSCNDNGKASEKVKEENVEAAGTRDAQATVYPKISFEEEEHDFGNIPQGKNVEHTFTFTNTGQAPLVITNAKSSCGCTVPTFTKEPVQPGETGEMLVKFNGSGKGQVSKTVTITANTENGTERLRIKAFVETEENAS